MTTLAVGSVYNDWTVLTYAGKSKSQYTCRCICGAICTVSALNVKRGSSVCCRECSNKRRVGVKLPNSANTTHGKSGTETWVTWSSMLNRCRNANDSSYLHYGGRGISVCLEWQTSFETFLRDMGERPNALYSIERKDVNKGYSKENCVWATDTEQARNKTNTVMLTAFGKSQTLDSWATEKGLRYHTIWARLLRGDSPEQALRPLERISPLRKEDRHVME